MRNCTLPIAILFALSCAPATAQQPGGAMKSKPGATANSAQPVSPGMATLGGKAMLKPGQTFIGGKLSGPGEGLNLGKHP
jgi:hypothetical protein